MIPDIVPMRRGRPPNGNGYRGSTQPSPSPLRGSMDDPFAALDSAPATVPTASPDDDISSRFPPLDQFSLLHDSGSKFAFDQKTSIAPVARSIKAKDISQRVTEALADDAFAVPKQEAPTHSRSVPSLNHASLKSSGTQTTLNASTLIKEKPIMVSTGTMTSPVPHINDGPQSQVLSRPIHRFASHNGRALSQSRIGEAGKTYFDAPPERSLHPHLSIGENRMQHPALTSSISNPSAPSRPSLDGQRTSFQNLERGLSRSKSTASRLPPRRDQQ